MADLSKKNQNNADGEFYVDSSCIDCDTCRWMAPDIFERLDHKSIVHQQPQSDYARSKALEAMIACPTDSIGCSTFKQEEEELVNHFPLLIEDNVYHTGFHSVKSYGATSYFIKRDSGNVLIDSPRFDLDFAHKLDELGGVEYMYFTHKDPVADHAKYHDYFNCQRILHSRDLNESLEDFEIKLEGDQIVNFTDDIKIIPSPGHTQGSAVMLYKEKFLFTGDHLAFSNSYNHLIGFQDYCWFSWDEQIKSMRKLFNHNFEWVLPGHGRRFHASGQKMRNEIAKCVSWMEKSRQVHHRLTQ